jgi:D-sedoheptulose 7-phosphate isomerase
VSADATGSLYPFLSSGAAEDADLVADVARSTVEKAAEIHALRQDTLRQWADRVAACAVAMADAFGRGARLLAFGNGGSSTDAADLVHAFLHPDRGRPLPAMSLAADVAVLTALANDVGFDVVFARQVAAHGRRGDIAVGLSTSGGSANVLRAFDEARARGLLTVGFAGYDGGAMRESAAVDHLFVVPSSSVHRIQEVQTTLYHVLWEATQAALTADEPRAKDQP